MAVERVDLKVVILGQTGTGKSCLLNRFIHNSFIEEYISTIGGAFAFKCMELRTEWGSTEAVTLGIWDTAGQERYESVTKLYYRGAGAAIVCYDLLDPSSWTKVEYWVGDLRAAVENCRIYVCGTKCDLLSVSFRVIEPEKVARFAKQINASGLFETSAKTGVNVVELFEKIAFDYCTHELCLRNDETNTPGYQLSSEQSQTLNSSNQKKRSCCGTTKTK